MTKKVITRLVEYPWPVVRLQCRFCPLHQPSYRLARLAARLGADTTLDEVLDRAACSLGRPKRLRKMQRFCGVFFCDLRYDPSPHADPRLSDAMWFDTNDAIEVPGPRKSLRGRLTGAQVAQTLGSESALLAP